MRTKKWAVILSALLLSSSLLSACSSSSTKKEPAKKAEAPAGQAKPSKLVIASDQDPVGLDPQKSPAASSQRIYNLVYDTLTRFDFNMNIIPSLAQKWTVAPDGMSVTFELQKGVNFHNGREMTSADVKYSFERILDPNTGALARSNLADVESIEAPDPNTVVFKLKKPNAALISNVGSPYTAIVPKEVSDLNKEAVGTGPYKLGAVVAGQSITLTKNPDYFVKGMPKIDTLEFRIMKDEAERMAAARAEKVDLTTVSVDYAKILEDNKDLTIKSYQSREYGYLGINVNKKPFDDVRVRQAISYSIDRNAIVNTVWNGKAQLTGPITPIQKAFALNVAELPQYKKDVNKAKELLKEAGYPNGFDTVLQTASTYPDMVQSAQVIQQQLKEIGINAKIEQLEWAKYLDTWKSKDMTLLVGRNTAPADPDASLGAYFSTKGGTNVWNYSNKDFDALTQKGLETNDLETRKKMYTDAQNILMNDAPNIFLASPQYFYLINNHVEGFVPNAASEAYAIMQASMK